MCKFTISSSRMVDCRYKNKKDACLMYSVLLPVELQYTRTSPGSILVSLSGRAVVYNYQHCSPTSTYDSQIISRYFSSFFCGIWQSNMTITLGGAWYRLMDKTRRARYSILLLLFSISSKHI